MSYKIDMFYIKIFRESKNIYGSKNDSLEF